LYGRCFHNKFCDSIHNSFEQTDGKFILRPGIFFQKIKPWFYFNISRLVWRTKHDTLPVDIINNNAAANWNRMSSYMKMQVAILRFRTNRMITIKNIWPFRIFLSSRKENHQEITRPFRCFNSSWPGGHPTFWLIYTPS
jgi:hypothetical protein